ncbi:hypothetical protein OH77DRAFT_410725 [Trametes cingulata]|nr:hypothetical protein OH77DRAFT_410725 [Trametes cingulata]
MPMSSIKLIRRAGLACMTVYGIYADHISGTSTSSWRSLPTGPSRAGPCTGSRTQDSREGAARQTCGSLPSLQEIRPSLRVQMARRAISWLCHKDEKAEVDSTVLRVLSSSELLQLRDQTRPNDSFRPHGPAV